MTQGHEEKMSEQQQQQQVFRSKFRVYYEDTDAGGIVYHANYLKFCERTRSDFVREALGYDQEQHLQEERKGFVVSKLSARFHSSARLGEVLTITCVPFALRRTTLQMYQEVRNEQGVLLFAMCVTLACLDFSKSKPTKLPEAFTQELQPYLWPQEPEMKL